jgi:hypothetical protein
MKSTPLGCYRAGSRAGKVLRRAFTTGCRDELENSASSIHPAVIEDDWSPNRAL